MLNIIPKRKIWFTISGILVAASLIFIAVNGLRLGIDFTGGSLIEVKITGENITSLSIEERVISSISEGAEVKVQSSGEDEYIIRTGVLAEGAHQIVLEKLAELGAVEELRFESIGPTLGEELKDKAFTALVVASIVIILYIAWSFRKVAEPVQSWKYGIGAIIALVHDVVIVTGVYALISTQTSYQIDALFVTALLVVLGYSVNDTIVVYDRVRENVLAKHVKHFETLVNKSVNETITRSINTSLTTFLVLLSLFFFGGDSIEGFVVALMVGVLIGTYSSIFIASPVLVTFEEMAKRKFHKKKK